MHLVRSPNDAPSSFKSFEVQNFNRSVRLTVERSNANYRAFGIQFVNWEEVLPSEERGPAMKL